MPFVPAEAPLLAALHVAEKVCFPIAHRQVVLTLPKRLRVHTRFDRKLLGKLSTCAWNCLKVEVQRLLGRRDVVPGMIAAIQTHGEWLHWNPHFHILERVFKLTETRKTATTPPWKQGFPQGRRSRSNATEVSHRLDGRAMGADQESAAA